MDTHLGEPPAESPADEFGPITFRDIGRIGPGTLAGRYLRRFWHPVYHSADLKPGTATAIRIMGEDFTLYRGETGTPFVVGAECPHRRMRMHVGWVKGDAIRCFYHGWTFRGDGQCIEQPPERPSFCHKVKMPAFPTQDYLGLVFAYFGPLDAAGQPPPLPRYPDFEADDVQLFYDSYTRACHFFNNLENGADKAHIGFVHHDASASWDEDADGPRISAEETSWGAAIHTVRPSGKRAVSHFGMPNVVHVCALPDDPALKVREFLGWWVPHDDDRHTQFTIVRHPRGSAAVMAYEARRAARAAGRDLDHRREEFARAILAGTMSWADIDPKRVNAFFLQDDVAQMGVGSILDRPPERLGRSDVGVILERKLWVRELNRFARGETLTNWRRDPAVHMARAEY